MEALREFAASQRGRKDKAYKLISSNNNLTPIGTKTKGFKGLAKKGAEHIRKKVSGGMRSPFNDAAPPGPFSDNSYGESPFYDKKKRGPFQ